MNDTCIPAMPYEPRGSVASLPPDLAISHAGLAFLGNAEPTLDELMADEVVRRVMARDGVRADQLLSLMDQVRVRLR